MPKLSDGLKLTLTYGEITARCDFEVKDFAQGKDAYDVAKRAIADLLDDPPPLVAAVKEAEKEPDGKRSGKT